MGSEMCIRDRLLTEGYLLGSDKILFNRDIRPILSDHCFSCHGPDKRARKADLRLDTYEGAIRDLGGYSAIVPGDPEKSELLLRTIHSDPEELMPPPKSKIPKLDSEKIRLLNQWIKAVSYTHLTLPTKA